MQVFEMLKVLWGTKVRQLARQPEGVDDPDELRWKLLAGHMSSELLALFEKTKDQRRE